jgi:GNAT superfamily N-acetyltransferase
MTARSVQRVQDDSDPGVIEGIVAVHRRAFPNHFMTRLGNGFLRHYYRTVLSFPLGTVLIAGINGRCCGFICGFGDPRAFYAHYRSRRLRAAPFVLASLLASPQLLPRVLQNFRRVSAVKGTASEVELSSLAIDPEWAGEGIGSELLRQFVGIARGSGYRSVYLTTDAVGNDTVTRFYYRHGFVLDASFMHGTRPMHRLRLLLSP